MNMPKAYLITQQVISIAFTIIFLVILSCNINTSIVHANDTEEGLFSEMEAEPAKTTEQESYTWIKQFGDNLEGSFRIKYSHFFRTPKKTILQDNDSDIGEALFRFSTWSGKDNLKIHLSGWAEAGTQDDTYQGVTHWPMDQDNYRRYFELNELYAFFSGENIDFTIGKKLFNTGICTLFSPSDRFSPADLHDPLDPKQFGIWQIKTDYYLDDSKFEFAIIPVYTDYKSPEEDSRWWGDTSHSLTVQSFINNLNKVVRNFITTEDPNISWDYVSYFAKYKTTINGWDLFLSTSSGPSPYSVLKIDWFELVEKKIRVNTLATGFSTTMGDFEIHGEVLYNRSEKNKDDDYINYVIGFNYTINDYARYFLMEEILLTLEYAKEHIVDKQDSFLYILSSKYGRLGTNDLFLRMQFKYNESLKFENMFHYKISDSAWMNRFEMSYRFKEGWTFTGAVEVFESNDDTINFAGQLFYDNISYAQWDKNDRIIFYLKYDF